MSNIAKINRKKEEGVIVTAEIGILNRSGVALAADSAVTIGEEENQKIYNSANKLFALSKFHPVGIMIFGGANFMGVPWETIIKTYRKTLGNTKFNTLKEYGNSFFEFLTSDGRFYNENTESNLVSTIFYKELIAILNNEVNTYINEITKSGEPVENSDVEKIMETLLINHIESLSNGKVIFEDNNFLPNFKKKHVNTVKQVLNSVINFELSDKVIKLYLEFCGRFIQSDKFSRNYTGLVISGYGEDEIFPSLFEFHIEGIFLGNFKYVEREPIFINSYIDETFATAAMRPFAQKDMVYSFINGIEPSLKNTIMLIIKNTIHSYNKILIKDFSLDEKFSDKEEGIINSVVEAIYNETNKIQNKYYTKPIIDILEILPKEELAAMAEALVNLTSFKRRISMDAETVGGPVDVCVITKGDGLVWIKRKHYFNPDLNYNFFKNYLREME